MWCCGILKNFLLLCAKGSEGNRNEVFYKSMKSLAVFDFDHTVIDDNSDTVVRDLIPLEKIPSSLKQLHRKDGWTSYMQGVFVLLNKHGFGKDEITAAIENIRPVEGMCELINSLKQELNYDIIIISDSNTYFIETWLKKFNLFSKVEKVFTNPAEFIDNLLKIEMYHVQRDCHLSTKNLCKGRILEEFVSVQKEKDMYYDKILYVGDGANDLCPILRLNTTDLACVRAEYKCVELVKLLELNKPVDNTGNIYKIKCKVFIWKTGSDILSRVKKDQAL